MRILEEYKERRRRESTREVRGGGIEHVDNTTDNTPSNYCGMVSVPEAFRYDPNTHKQIMAKSEGRTCR